MEYKLKRLSKFDLELLYTSVNNRKKEIRENRRRKRNEDSDIIKKDNSRSNRWKNNDRNLKRKHANKYEKHH